MTLGAGQAEVCPGELEPRMVEFGALPLAGVVAHRAILGESRGGVVGILGVVVVGQVTGNARRGRALETVVLMALDAGHAGVCPTEREPGGGVVIELGTLPLRSIMTCRTILGKTRSQVVGILGVVVVGQVAGYARRGRTSETVIEVASIAGD